ncbi:MAG: hydroxyacylglutathione hydrolase [Methylococcales bacterium]|nr:hydroxyacylglutathione hydrolase [Methylococcales bacterium]
MLEIIQIPVLSDNYIYLLHDTVSGETAAVDPAVAEPVLAILKQRGWQLTYILNTHHHGDHVGGNVELKRATGCQIIGSAKDKHRIPAIDRCVSEGERITIGSHSAQVIDTAGHTSGHIVYYFAEDNALFCGDTLFVMGCGRLFEGSAEQLWQSLQKLKALPAETRVYCAHEYTENNARFALSVESANLALHNKMTVVQQQRAKGLPTVPSTIADELATNPFFREHSTAIRASLHCMEHKPVEVFVELRRLKDSF